MTYNYKITLKQQFLLLYKPFTKNIALFLIIKYFSDYLLLTETWVVLILIFLIDFIPAFILHIQYLITNWNCSFIINTEKRTFSYYSPKKSIDNGSFDNIQKLEYHVSYGRKTGVYSFASYRYYKIFLNDGSTIFITCLMVNRIEDTLELLFRTRAEKEFSFLCFIK